LGTARAADRDAAGARFEVGARHRREDLGEVTPLRDAIDSLRRDDRDARVLLDVDEWRLRRDLHGFADACDRHRQIDRQDLAERKDDVLVLRRRESREIRAYIVPAWRKRGEPVDSALVGGGRLDSSSGLVLGFDRDAGQYTALRVLDRSLN